MPNMADPYFSRTLTYVCEHNDQGALGIVVNRPIDMTLQALFERLSLSMKDTARADAPIYFGGPVQTDRGFVLHEPAGRLAGDAEGDRGKRRRHRPHHLQGHPRGGRARRGAGEDAGVARLCRLVGRADRARAVAERLADGGSEGRRSSSTCRPTSACPRRWSCWASITRASPTRRDMPDKARRPAAGTVLAFDFGLQRIGVAVGEPELGTAHRCRRSSRAPSPGA